ncbi:hypothetical protein C7C45_26530 [Micromonospora arborensis]|uniref:Uncharacterized protein n=1 Tax=Micromonospora arborensis TaxID=2116518 RepID=A0A318NCB2_9ACTN|nr:hypothetical protein C7C45_26530 [Micromonospora arborensis]
MRRQPVRQPGGRLTDACVGAVQRRARSSTGPVADNLERVDATGPENAGAVGHGRGAALTVRAMTVSVD